MSRLEQLKKLVAIAGDDPMSHYGLGLEYLQLNQWDAAAAAFAAALAVDPNYSAAYYHRGRALIGAGRVEEARATLAQGATVAQAAGDWKTVNEMQELLGTIA